jgi:hypothetical protein
MLAFRPKFTTRGEWPCTEFGGELTLTTNGKAISIPALDVPTTAPVHADALSHRIDSDTEHPTADNNISKLEMRIPEPRRPVISWADDEDSEDEEMTSDNVLGATNSLNQEQAIVPVARAGPSSAAGPIVPAERIVADPTAPVDPTEGTPSTAPPDTIPTAAKKAEMRRLKNKRKRLARAGKRRKQAEEAARLANNNVKKELAELGKVLAATTAMVEAAKKQVVKLERALAVSKRKRKRMGDEDREHGKKKKKYFAPQKAPLASLKV